MEQFIICPNCGAIEIGTIDTTTIPWNTFIHHCSKCEYIIMESDWEPAKAISIKQPWASLICLGIKDIENRTWKLPEKYKGKMVLVHAGSAKAKFNFSLLQHHELNRLNLRRWYDREQIKGAIIGSVEIVDCVINHPSIWAKQTDDFLISQQMITYNWILANPVRFDKPIPCKGQLSFFNPQIPE